MQLLDLLTNVLLLGANPQFFLLGRGELPEQLVHLGNGVVLWNVMQPQVKQCELA